MKPSYIPVTNSPVKTSSPSSTSSTSDWTQQFSVAPTNTLSGSSLQNYLNQLYSDLYERNTRQVEIEIGGVSLDVKASGNVLPDKLHFQAQGSASNDSWFSIDFDYRTKLSIAAAETSFELQFYAIIEYVETNGESGYQDGSDTLAQYYSGQAWDNWTSTATNTNYSQFSITTQDGVTTFTVGYSGQPNTTISGSMMNQNQAKLDLALNNFPWAADNSQLCVAGKVIVDGKASTKGTSGSTFGLLNNNATTTQALISWVETVLFDGVSVNVYSTGWTQSSNGNSSYQWSTLWCFNTTTHATSIVWDPDYGIQSTGIAAAGDIISWVSSGSGLTSVPSVKIALIFTILAMFLARIIA